jgi:hypothetical protein
MMIGSATADLVLSTDDNTVAALGYLSKISGFAGDFADANTLSGLSQKFLRLHSPVDGIP